jgi:hypothetical protein
MEAHRIYFGRRAAEEREAARKSTNRIVQDRHFEFADAYDYRAREMAAVERQLMFPPEPAA